MRVNSQPGVIAASPSPGNSIWRPPTTRTAPSSRPPPRSGRWTRRRCRSSGSTRPSRPSGSASCAHATPRAPPSTPSASGASRSPEPLLSGADPRDHRGRHEAPAPGGTLPTGARTSGVFSLRNTHAPGPAGSQPTAGGYRPGAVGEPPTAGGYPRLCRLATPRALCRRLPAAAGRLAHCRRWHRTSGRFPLSLSIDDRNVGLAHRTRLPLAGQGKGPRCRIKTRNASRALVPPRTPGQRGPAPHAPRRPAVGRRSLLRPAGHARGCTARLACIVGFLFFSPFLSIPVSFW